ncbi:U3 snoRNP protein [Coemansia sp. RSA 1365]|nr:U3 snoRNP protein [Coemansia sp. RSA 1365]
MAEVVQYHLEQMVDELEDLEKRGLFSKAELKTIVKKRTKFEYGLRRRRVGRAAFLHYIEYEINVDALRRQRKQRLAGEKRGEKTTLSDFSIAQRVISIFERALVKHPEDAMLWLQYIEFIKARRRMVPGIGDEEGESHSRLLSSVFARAITAHPYESQMWIKAAAHELDVNANSNAARVLLQRGLRLIPEDQRLWIEYFRLEMLLVEKIKARRRVLGIDQPSADANALNAESATESTEMETADDNAFIDLPQLDEEENSERSGSQIDSVEERFAEQALARLDRKTTEGNNITEEDRITMAQQTNAYLQGAVTKIIYEKAIKAIPNSVEFRQELASVAALFSNTEGIREIILSSIRNDFERDTQARAYLCSAHLASVSTTSPELVDGLHCAVGNFKKTLEEIDTSNMWTEYVRFLIQWHNACEGMESLRAYFAVLIDRAVVQIGENKDGRLNAELALICADNIQKRMEQNNDDSNSSEMRLLNWLADATQRFPTSADLWHRRLSSLLAINADSGSADVASDSRIGGLFADQALVQVPASKKLWNLFLDWIEQRFTKCQISADHVQSHYFSAFARTTQQRSVLSLSTDDSALSKLYDLVAHLQIRYVDWAWNLPLHRKQLSAIGDIAQMELDDDEEEEDVATENNTKNIKNVEALRQAYRNVSRHAFPTLSFYRRCLELEPDSKNKIMLHEMACRVDESDLKPWLAYLLNQASTVYWRATKAIGDTKQLEFETAYQSLLHNSKKYI